MCFPANFATFLGGNIQLLRFQEMTLSALVRFWEPLPLLRAFQTLHQPPYLIPHKTNANGINYQHCN